MTFLKSIYDYFKEHQNYALLLGVFILASFFRLYKLDSIPFGLNNDAAWEGSAAINILHGNLTDYFPYAAEGWRGEGIIRIIVAFFTVFLGNNPLTIKLASTIFGIGLIIPLFFLIRSLFTTRLAVITTFLVAISGWHITFSKTGWRAVTVPFFTTLVFYFLIKGLNSKNPLHFILSGSFLSLVTFYTYDAARAVPLFFIFWLVIEAISRKSFIKIYAKNLAILIFSFTLISLPILFYAINNWQNFTSRSDFLFVGHEIEKIGNFSPLIDNIKTSALLFNVKANGNDFFIFEPLVDKPVSWLLPIGFLICCYFTIIKRDKRFLFIVCWFLFSLLPGLLSVPNGNRAIGTIVPVYTFAAAGLLFPLLLLLRHLPKPNLKYIVFVFILLFSAYSTYLTYRDYLGPNRRELPGFYPETLVNTNYIKDIWNNYDIILTDNYPRELLTYYLYKDGQKDAFDRNYFWVESSNDFLNIPLQSRNKNLAFFMFANEYNETIVNKLLLTYPKASKKYLYYIDDNINRPASLVVLIPNKNE